MTDCSGLSCSFSLTAATASGFGACFGVFNFGGGGGRRRPVGRAPVANKLEINLVSNRVRDGLARSMDPLVAHLGGCEGWHQIGGRVSVGGAHLMRHVT